MGENDQKGTLKVMEGWIRDVMKEIRKQRPLSIKTILK